MQIQHQLICILTWLAAIVLVLTAFGFLIIIDNNNKDNNGNNNNNDNNNNKIMIIIIMKGWKKRVNRGTKPIKKSPDARMKEIYKVQAGEIRKNISIVVPEIERLRANRKLISKGKKNRAKLLKNCKSLSIADLVVYMEKEKSKLRKLKRNFWRVKRLEEARKINQKFYADPGSIDATFGKMLESQVDIDKPKYDRVT